MNTVETYVIVPLMKWTQMEDAAMKKSTPPPQPATTEEVKEEEEPKPHEPLEEPEDSPPPAKAPAKEPPSPLLPTTKELVTKKMLGHKHFEKFFEAVKAYGGKIPELPNIEALIRSALGKSKRVLENEEEFYQFLSAHGLVHLIKNPFKIKRYVPSWFRVA